MNERILPPDVIGQAAVFEDKAGVHYGHVTDYRRRTYVESFDNGDKRFHPEYVEIDIEEADCPVQINPNRVLLESDE